MNSSGYSLGLHFPCGSEVSDKLCIQTIPARIPTQEQFWRTVVTLGLGLPKEGCPAGWDDPSETCRGDGLLDRTTYLGRPSSCPERLRRAEFATGNSDMDEYHEKLRH